MNELTLKPSIFASEWHIYDLK